MTKGPGNQNELARKSAEMTYPSIYKKHKYGATNYAQYDYKSVKKAKNQKVVVKSSGTGKIYGARTVAQRSVENQMTTKVTGNLLKSALEILTDNVIPQPKIKVTRLAETTLEDPTMVNDPNVPGNNIEADQWADQTPPSITSPTPSVATKELSSALRALRSVKRTLSNLRKKAAQENDEILVLSCEHEADMVDAAVAAIKRAKQSLGDDTAEPTSDTSDTAPTLDAGHIPHVAGYTPEGKPVLEYSLGIQKFKAMKRLRVLKQKLEAGETVNINDAYYKHSSKIHDEFNWGELEKLGFAERVDVRGSQGAYNTAWKFTGPPGSSIVVVTQTGKLENGKATQGKETKVLRPGETTDFTEVDYS
jgi:hypothetical protein